MQSLYAILRAQLRRRASLRTGRINGVAANQGSRLSAKARTGLQDLAAVPRVFACRHPADGSVKAVGGQGRIGGGCHPNSWDARSADCFDHKRKKSPADPLASISINN